YLNHDDLADRYGNHTLRITTRQGIQFHGVLKKNLKAVIRGIHSKLGTTSGACGDVVRNVMACPAPLQDRKRMEVFRYAQAVSDQFLSQAGAYYEIWLNGEKVKSPSTGEKSEPIYGKTYLPRKFKIAMAFPDDNCTDIYSNDIGIVPEIGKETLKGFNILVGGGFGMTHGIKGTYPRLADPLCFVKPEELLEITKAIVLTQRDFGDRTDRKHARMKYLIAEKGLDWFRAEVEKRFGKKTEPCRLIHWQGIENHLGWHSEGNGKWFLGLAVENGRVKDEGSFKLKTGLRKAIEKFHPEVYLTAQQDIILSGLQEGQKKDLETLLTSFGIVLPDQLS
ncbi:MAG: NADPH-dependent assimilatory sulfite reductase hemoprotein subunit, partial [Candidatus Omnitrophica bacterium]|nr:NADPH-dependent assimilatory sulfite reductase hemoprotein subunit [Candidatus Omnitrophota bacterium]